MMQKGEKISASKTHEDALYRI